MTANSEFERAVTKAIQKLRPGEVASYGEIAQEAGYPGRARGVGKLLSTAEGLPWWRVVRSDGRLVSPSAAKQERLLRKEGVRVVDGRVRSS